MRCHLKQKFVVARSAFCDAAIQSLTLLLLRPVNVKDWIAASQKALLADGPASIQITPYKRRVEVDIEVDVFVLPLSTSSTLSNILNGCFFRPCIPTGLWRFLIFAIFSRLSRITNALLLS